MNNVNPHVMRSESPCCDAQKDAIVSQMNFLSLTDNYIDCDSVSKNNIDNAHAHRQMDKIEKPALPDFTECQKSLLRSSWAELQCERRTKLHQLGAQIFVHLFEYSPTFKAAFAHFKRTSEDELADSPLLKAHAMSVLHVVEQLVNYIDNMNKWDEIVEGLAHRHVDRATQSHLAPVRVAKNRGKQSFAFRTQ
jgi:hypothetical protein